MISELMYLPLIFFSIAFFYSMAGFGGGSSYLAVLVLFPLSFEEIRFIALVCNIIVVSSSLIIFYQNRLLNLKKTLPLILLSIPLAFFGGRLQINEFTFFLGLGILLFIASLLMWFSPSQTTNKKNSQPSFIMNSTLGGGIGFLSGMVGIGGGIFLSPILHLGRWDKAKVIAASCSFFILANSSAGLIGQSINLNFTIPIQLIMILGVSVFIGSQLGSRLSSKRFNSIWIRKITAILILIVAIRILIETLV